MPFQVWFVGMILVSVIEYFQVRNKQRNFVWVQFSDLQLLYEQQAKGLETLTAHAAQVAALMTCSTAVGTVNVKRCSTKELKNALIQLDDRVRQLHSALPSQSMLIVASGHGDIATVRRYVITGVHKCNFIVSK